ncbi:MAG TPA: aldo/keto reductase [bacterium]|nr:aldo/keto reductase [bacterium]HOM27065.1 aldo/keto reductase [bacterium]
MIYKTIGKSDIKVSAMAIGAWQIGGQWGNYDKKEVEKIIDSAIENGVNFIDTAEAYGESESVLGEILKGKRDKFVIATKIGGNHFDYKTVKEHLTGSLKRLKTDFVDLYQVHWPKMKHLWHKEDMNEKDYYDIADSMTKLQKEGLIRYAGVSNFRKKHLLNFPEEIFSSVIVSNQVPYSLLWRCYDIDGTTNFCIKNKIDFLAYSPLAEGLLTGRFKDRSEIVENVRKANVLFNEPVYSKALKVVEEIEKIAKELDMTIAQISINWCISKNYIASALVGMRKAKHFEENIKAFGKNLPEEIIEKLDNISMDFQKNYLVEGLELWIGNCLKENLEKIGIKRD